jgi:hypothetical protein
MLIFLDHYKNIHANCATKTPSDQARLKLKFLSGLREEQNLKNRYKGMNLEDFRKWTDLLDDFLKGPMNSIEFLKNYLKILT